MDVVALGHGRQFVRAVRDLHRGGGCRRNWATVCREVGLTRSGGETSFSRQPPISGQDCVTYYLIKVYPEAFAHRSYLRQSTGAPSVWLYLGV
jgi:hypothetical protein